ncbi:LPS sulfotransferase NodH [Roseivivax marinus]|uniref:Stf0 family sulfotransferase n=1 Tax=Roseivivax marinus TaxID=1379903 RepID=UPI0008D6FD96|nr:Stf0 family sulfotransferase [Roseivivax marinus]SEL91956.1 LPS sulfotransferase NodH [Roseivivax marinus]
MDIILCATQRCGSTLVIEDMRNTGVLGQPEEWFIPWDPGKTDLNWEEHLTSVQSRATGDNGVSAIKIMANQLDPVDRCLATFLKADREGEFAHVATAFPQARWVWLRRNDVVSQAISRIMAQQTGINHATAKPEDAHFSGNMMRGYNPNYNKNAVYQYDAILSHVTAITLENLVWQRFFESQGISPLKLTYEDVILDDTMSHLDTFAELAGVATPVPKTPRKMVKVGNSRNSEWRERFLRDAAKKNFKHAAPN